MRCRRILREAPSAESAALPQALASGCNREGITPRSIDQDSACDSIVIEKTGDTLRGEEILEVSILVFCF